MTSRAQRLRDRRGHRGAPPTFISGATDEIDGPGRLGRPVLPGDGLTTTSLEIPTGHRIEVRVCRHRMLSAPHTFVPSPRRAADSR